MTDHCYFCDKEVREDDKDAFDSEHFGIVHGQCLDDFEKDAPNRADDYFTDRARGT